MELVRMACLASLQDNALRSSGVVQSSLSCCPSGSCEGTKGESVVGGNTVGVNLSK